MMLNISVIYLKKAKQRLSRQSLYGRIITDWFSWNYILAFVLKLLILGNIAFNY